MIGNAHYQFVTQLPNPANDANLVASKLGELGFAVVGDHAQNDVALPTFRSLLTQFATLAAQADVAIFYYAGHGVQINGVNYLVPTDSNPVNGVSDVPLQMVDASAVLTDLDQANSRLKIMILDACRNNPFASRGLVANGLADMSRGLAAMSTPQGTVIWYAAEPGKTASDGTGNNGPFALAISHNIDVPGRDIYAVFNKTALEVMSATNPKQIPWLAASPLDGDFYFKQGPDSQTRALFANPPKDSSPTERVRRLFSLGLTTPTRGFTLGETYTQINSKLDQPFWIKSWDDLPLAGEFTGREVRYLWVPLSSLPVVSSAIVPDRLAAGECIDPQSYITFLFEDQRLFSISIRLYKSQACSSYGWVSDYIFTGNHRSALIHTAQGDTVVKSFDTPVYSFIEIDKLDSSRVWLD
ncbi:MAG: caspase domain-containing protein [Terriglobales bacterium]